MKWVLLLPLLLGVAETVLPQLWYVVSGRASGPAIEVMLLTTPPSYLNFTNPSLGPFATCRHEQLALQTCASSDLTPPTNSYLLTSLCHPCLPSLTRLLKWEQGSR